MAKINTRDLFLVCDPTDNLGYSITFMTRDHSAEEQLAASGQLDEGKKWFILWTVAEHHYAEAHTFLKCTGSREYNRATVEKKIEILDQVVDFREPEGQAKILVDGEVYLMSFKITIPVTAAQLVRGMDLIEGGAFIGDYTNI